MRRDLNVRFDGVNKPYDWYVSGQDLLTMVAAAAQSVSGGGRAPATAGTSQDTAWLLNDYAAWVGAWQRLLTDRGLIDRVIYFDAGGRKLKKSAKARGTGDGFYMSDVGLAGTDRTAGNMWNRHDGASYREYGRFMQDKMPVSPLEQVVWSKKIAGKLREVLKGGKDYSGKGAGDVQSALPVLAVTMFLAEPARNPREWVIGLMMLDLIGEEYSAATAAHGSKRYLMDLVMAHPDRIDRGKRASDAPTKAQSGPDRQRYHKEHKTRIDDPQGLAAVADVTGLARVEGKYPASPGGSAATSERVDVANDYIQMKESSIACRWVASRLEEGVFKDLASWSAIALKAGTPLNAKQQVSDVARDADSPTRKGCAQEVLDEIRRLINARAASFD